MRVISIFFLLGIFFSFCSRSTFSSNASEIFILDLNDVTINPVIADYLIRSIDQAQEERAHCVVIKMDTPGGLLESTRKIVKRILSTKVPIVVYIFPSGARAGSAGVFITYASHIAAMAPSTNIGAAHPVEFGGRGPLGIDFKKIKKEDLEKENSSEDPMQDKILNDTVAFIKAMAEKRKRNVEWAVKSVAQSDSITETEALKKGVIELIAKDEKDLLNQLEGKTVEIDGNTVTLHTQGAMIRRIDMDFRERFFNILANPNIAYIFLILGFYGLLFEITHPGSGVPGVVGGILLILSFFSMQLLPTNYAGVALIFLAVGLFIADVKVAGTGFLTIGGLVSMILGSMLLFESPLPMMKVSLIWIAGISMTTAAITLFWVYVVARSQKRKIRGGKGALVGEEGVVYSEITPERGGKVFVHGEIWSALSDRPIKKDEKIKIIGVQGFKVNVQKIPG